MNALSKSYSVCHSLGRIIRRMKCAVSGVKEYPSLINVILFFFYLFFLFMIVPAVLCFFGIEMDATAWITLLLTFVTGFVIWWQGKQLKKQLELQTLTELYKEWNGKEMRKARHELCSVLYPNAGIYDLDKVEDVLEFLERIASFYLHKVLSKELIWATIGWYITRYYHYADKADAIKGIRYKWHNDPTLYGELPLLYKDLMVRELCFRIKEGDDVKSIPDIEKQFDKELDKFKQTERYDES